MMSVVLTQKQKDGLKKALASIKRRYGATAIKFELEAQLEREAEDRECYECSGSGELFNEDEDTYENCEYCAGTGERENGNWSCEDCESFIEERLSPKARNATIYKRFYNDGSVDSELTVTLKINEAEYILEYLEAWNALAEEIGNGMDVSGAGFHIALINSRNGTYPHGCEYDYDKALNFARAMERLLPALYFLASPDYRSRGLNYRHAKIGLDDKYSAITGHRSVFEYRVFETCYNKPEAVIDYICVIANTLKFYTNKPPKVDWFGKIGELVMPEGEGLKRFYSTEKHIDALNKGLAILKPEYKSVQQLKKERGGVFTKQAIKIDKQKTRERLSSSWADYKERADAEYKRQFEMYSREWERILREYRPSEVTHVWGDFDNFMKDRVKKPPRSLSEYVNQVINQNNYGETIRV